MKHFELQPPPDSAPPDRRERDPREPFQPPKEEEPEEMPYDPTREEPVDDPGDTPGRNEPEWRDPPPTDQPPEPLEVSA